MMRCILRRLDNNEASYFLPDDIPGSQSGYLQH